RPLEQLRDAILRPRHLQQRPAHARPGFIFVEGGHLCFDGRIEVGGAPAELPDVDVRAGAGQPGAQIGEWKPLVQDVGQTGPAGLGAAWTQIEELRRHLNSYSNGDVYFSTISRPWDQRGNSSTSC